MGTDKKPFRVTHASMVNRTLHVWMTPDMAGKRLRAKIHVNEATGEFLGFDLFEDPKGNAVTLDQEPKGRGMRTERSSSVYFNGNTLLYVTQDQQFRKTPVHADADGEPGLPRWWQAVMPDDRVWYDKERNLRAMSIKPGPTTRPSPSPSAIVSAEPERKPPPGPDALKAMLQRLLRTFEDVNAMTEELGVRPLVRLTKGGKVLLAGLNG